MDISLFNHMRTRLLKIVVLVVEWAVEWVLTCLSRCYETVRNTNFSTEVPLNGLFRAGVQGVQQ